jgi:hypothetical protein
MKALALLVVAVVLIGCSSKGGDGAASYGVGDGAALDNGKKALPINDPSLAETNAKIRKQLEPCDVLFGIETQEAKEKATRNLWFRVIGFTATSVVAPTLIAANAAANAPWTAAATGVGGVVIASNDAADGMGISGVSALRSLAKLGTAIGPSVDTAEDISLDSAVRSAAAAVAARKCRYFIPDVNGGGGGA